MMISNHLFTNILFYICYGAMAQLALAGCLYLLLRRNNAFTTDITSPLRLRRWMAFTYASVAMSHVWWLLFFYGQEGGDPASRILLCRGLDVIFNWSATFYTMLVMLQDRRRPLWLVAVFVVLGLTELLVNYHLGTQMPWATTILAVITLLYVVTTLVIAVRQYGRWLRENYADLEYKEVWQTYLVMTAFLPTIFFYIFSHDSATFNILLEVVDAFLLIVLLWRVETLQSLEEPVAELTTEITTELTAELTAEPSDEPTDLSSYAPVFAKIELMLQKKCINTQYYLHHDVSLSNLSEKIGTNKTYLSRYFAHQGLTYNTYINTLRIEHFMRLYLTTIRTRQFVTATELAYKSGYKSYSTFSVAFKQINGQPVSAWMREQDTT